MLHVPGATGSTVTVSYLIDLTVSVSSESCNFVDITNFDSFRAIQAHRLSFTNFNVV